MYGVNCQKVWVDYLIVKIISAKLKLGNMSCSKDNTADLSKETNLKQLSHVIQLL